MQVGDGNVQINYAYYQTWTDGLAPPPLVGVTGAVDSPYRGLGAFEERDAAFFFGREQAATQVLERMSRLVPGPGLLVVSGASGQASRRCCGPGSCCGCAGAGWPGRRARRRGRRRSSLPAARRWTSWRCSSALLAGADAAAVRRGLGEDPARFALTARQAAWAKPPAPGAGPPGAAARGAGERRLLLVVDQFEQVFTQCADDAQRGAFITARAPPRAAGTTPAGRPRRWSCWGCGPTSRPAAPGTRICAAPVEDRYLLTPMTERQLRMVVTGPAKEPGAG